MAYIDFNKEGINGDNLDEFLVVLRRFAQKRGEQAAQRWLFKLNPLAQDHRKGEMYFTGGEYSRTRANAIVYGEYSHAPLPAHCTSCDRGVAWYKATFGAHRCTSCRALNLDADRTYLDQLLTPTEREA